MKSPRAGSHSVQQLQVPLVWSTKYRYQVLMGEVQLRCRDLLRQTCNAQDVQLRKGVVSKDHIHLHVSYPPALSISALVRRLKGRSATLLLQEFPELKRRYWGGHFWGIGYGAWSVGNIREEVLEAYLNHHKEQPNGNENFILEEAGGTYRLQPEQPTFSRHQTYGLSVHSRLVLGRRTYDAWADFWPQAGDSPMANGLNAATKYVATHRPQGLAWDPAQALGADLLEEVRRVQATDGPDLIICGSSTLTSVLLDQGLVNEVLLLVYPVLLGRGTRFFSDRVAPRALTFVSSQVTATGVLLNAYRPGGGVQPI